MFASNLKLSTFNIVATALLPIVTPSTEPPLISAVSATSASILAVPSINKSLNSFSKSVEDDQI